MAKPSLSIRRFWGKGERWKRKLERGEGEEGRPDTQARRNLVHVHFVVAATFD